MGKELQLQLEGVAEGFSKTRREIVESVDLKKYPLNAEPALVHPSNSSVVKIRDNGMIDLFVGTDNGIRIDPKHRSISLLANTYGEKSTTHNQTVTRNMNASIGGNWTVKVKGNLTFTTEGSMNFTAQKDISLLSKKGSISLRTEDTYGNIDIHARNHVNTASDHTDRSHHKP